jgi:hypothetical protein
MALFFSFSIGVHFAYAKTFKWLAYTTGGREFWLLLKVSRAANSGTRSMWTVFHVVHDKEDAFIFMPPGRVFVFFLVSHRLPTYSCKVQSSSSQPASTPVTTFCPLLSCLFLIIIILLPPGLLPSTVVSIRVHQYLQPRHEETHTQSALPKS